MEKIVDELFKLVDNSSIEKILKSITILDNMTKEEVHFINLFIENDKKNNFSRIKHLYALEFSISYGYLVDKIENRVIFKIITSELSVYIRTTLTKTLQKYEKITIINIEKTILNILNAKMEDGINKNIESNNYVIKSKQDVKIFDLINFLNNNLEKKIKINWLKNTKNHKIINLKNLLKKEKNINKKILKIFNENN